MTNLKQILKAAAVIMNKSRLEIKEKAEEIKGTPFGRLGKVTIRGLANYII